MLIKLNIFWITDDFVTKQINKIKHKITSVKFVWDYLRKIIHKKSKPIKLVITKDEYKALYIYLYLTNSVDFIIQDIGLCKEGISMCINIYPLIATELYGSISIDTYLHDEDLYLCDDEVCNYLSLFPLLSKYIKSTLYIPNINNNKCVNEMIINKAECDCTINSCYAKMNLKDGINYLFNKDENYTIIISFSDNFIHTCNNNITKYIYKWNIILSNLVQNNQIISNKYTYNNSTKRVDYYNIFNHNNFNHNNEEIHNNELIHNSYLEANINKQLFETKINLPISKLLIKLLNNYILYPYSSKNLKNDSNKNKLIKIIYVLKYKFANIINYEIMINRLIHKIIIC